MFKTTKAKIIFVVIFSFICLMITSILILYKNIEIDEKQDMYNIEEDLNNQVKEKDVSGIDLKGTYNQNDLIIEEKSVTQEKIEIRYFQISGLKNKTIENKINKEIEIAALNCYKDKIKDLNEILNVQVSMWKASNFANTISFELTYYAKIDDNDDGYYQGVYGLNYDLNTGKKITIDKVFTSDVPVENVLRKSIYYSLIQNRTEENLSGNLIVSNYGNIEDEIAEIIYDYKSGKLTEFYYTPRYINIIYNDDVIYIDMMDYAEYIAIYNRYLNSESLYENDNIGMKNVYTLAVRYNNVFYYENYQNENNYLIDISIDFQSADSDDFAKKLIDNKIIEIEEEIENIKQKASQNQNEFYILNYFISIYTGEEWSTQQIVTSYTERGNTYEMTVHDFEENIEPIIMEYNRQDDIGAVSDYIYDFTKIINIEPQDTVEYYNPENEEKIVI